MESIHNISSMRRRFLNNNANLNMIQMDALGVSVLLAKVNISVDEQVFRVNGDEIRFPEETFTGELKDALQDGTTQVSANIRRGEKRTQV